MKTPRSNIAVDTSQGAFQRVKPNKPKTLKKRKIGITLAPRLIETYPICLRRGLAQGSSALASSPAGPQLLTLNGESDTFEVLYNFYFNKVKWEKKI